MIKLLYQFILFSSFLLLTFSCRPENKFPNLDSGNELHRKLVIEEWLSENDENGILRDSINKMLSLQYVIPDTISPNDARLNYIHRNPKLPNFIKKALIEESITKFMSIGEFFLSQRKIASQLRISHPNRLEEYFIFPNKIQLGYEKYYNKESGLIQAGPYWEFRYGFLWEYGEI